MMTLKSNQRGDCFALTTAFIETRCECTTDSLIIGCVLSGIKHIEANGLCVTLREGDIFYICKGAYIETNIPLGSYTYDDLCVMIYDHEIEQLQHAFSCSESRASVVTTECIGRIGRIGNVRHNDLFAFFKEVERAILGFQYKFFPALERNKKTELIELLHTYSRSALRQIIARQAEMESTALLVECEVMPS